MTILGTLYIISAPSGAGKTSLVKKLLENTPGIEVSVSHTTRAARAAERDGVDYHFVDAPTFQALVKQDMFLEHAKVFDHDYGTSRHAVLERLRAGIDVILEIDWQGARQVRARFPRTQTIFILPPSRTTLRERLQTRGQDSPETVERRLQEAANDISHCAEFDYLVINDDFAAASEALRAIFIANRQRRELQLVRQRSLLQILLS